MTQRKCCRSTLALPTFCTNVPTSWSNCLSHPSFLIEHLPGSSTQSNRSNQACVHTKLPTQQAFKASSASAPRSGSYCLHVAQDSKVIAACFTVLQAFVIPLDHWLLYGLNVSHMCVFATDRWFKQLPAQSHRQSIQDASSLSTRTPFGVHIHLDQVPHYV